MAYWYIRSDSSVVRANIASDRGEVELSSWRRIRINEGDGIIFLRWAEREPAGKDLVFIKVSEIERIESVERTDIGYNRYFLLVSSVRDLPHKLSVTDLAYSLRKIKIFKKPRTHFRYSYGWLPKEDFDTISSGTIFYARTAFLSFFHSLPRTLQLEFQRETFPLTVNTLDEPFPYKLRWEELLEYLNKRIFSVGNILCHIEDMWPELLDEPFSPKDSLYFSDGKEEPESLVDAFDLFNRSWRSLLNEETDRKREDWLQSPLFRKTNKRVSEEEQRQMENRFRFEEQWPILSLSSS